MESRAIFIEKYGKPNEAFQEKIINVPTPKKDEVLIAVSAFGINYADIMSRKGMYRDAPAAPFVPGYEVVGEVAEIGAEVSELSKGDKVLAFTRFGGYAKHAVSKALGVVKLASNISDEQGLALGTQYATAYYAAFVATQVFEGEKVLIQAGAGGVGIGLIQLLKSKNCKIAATAGSDNKIELLKELGVDLPINYRKQDFFEAVKRDKNFGKVDVVFESVGGKSFKKGRKLLGAGGRIVVYGVANRKKGLLSGLRLLTEYGINHPLGYLMASKSLVGVNMLRVGDYKPQVLQHCLKALQTLAQEKKINPVVGKVFSSSDIAQAHAHVENRQSVGKVAVRWDA